MHANFTILLLDKLKARNFNATSLSTYDCSSLYIILPHNLMKINLLILLTEHLRVKALLILHVTTETHFLLRKTKKNIMHGLVKMYMMR